MNKSNRGFVHRWNSIPRFNSRSGVNPRAARKIRRAQRADFFLFFKGWEGEKGIFFGPKAKLISARNAKNSAGARSAPIFFWFFRGWGGEQGVFLGPKAKLISARSAENSARAARRFFLGFLKGGRVRREFFLQN